MLADCQSKTFTNARNECKESAESMRGKYVCIYELGMRRRTRGFATRDGAMRISAWLKSISTGEAVSLNLSISFSKEIGMIHHSSMMVRLSR